MLISNIEIFAQLSDEELEAITGGLQPQPLPPGKVFSSALRSDVSFIHTTSTDTFRRYRNRLPKYRNRFMKIKGMGKLVVV